MSKEVFAGVADLCGQGLNPVTTAARAAGIVLQQAERAANLGTFGVGGLLLGPEGVPLAHSQNRVMMGGRLHDPTAHAERQLLDWVFHNQRRLPSMDELTIVTSLDPCLMCAGAILRAGVRVYTLSLDPLAGVNWNYDGIFSALPPQLRELGQWAFAYLGVSGGRPYQGAPSEWSDQLVDLEVEQRSTAAFERNLEAVQRSVYAEAAPSDMAGGVALDLGEALLRTARASHRLGNSFDAAALVDPAGGVRLVVGGQETRSPLRTPFMELTRGYARLGQSQKQPHFKRCRVVTLMGPGNRDVDLMALGAYGSTVEGPLPEGSSRHWEYVIARQSLEELKAMRDRLPPFYRNLVRPDIQQIVDTELILHCTQALESTG
jgi:tRNA(Arg) A34 adenosine deaminase TadA